MELDCQDVNDKGDCMFRPEETMYIIYGPDQLPPTKYYESKHQSKNCQCTIFFFKSRTVMLLYKCNRKCLGTKINCSIE